MTVDDIDEIYKHTTARDTWLETEYPLTIIADRYSGAYSGGAFLAFPVDYYEIPARVSASDIECCEFWDEYTGYVGLGGDPEEALKSLRHCITNKIHYNEL